MHRVRLINKIIGPSNGIFPVCGRSGKLYGHASYMPEHGGPVLDMSMDDYEKDKFDIIGNRQSGQQWVPQFYEVPSVVIGPELTFDENGNVVDLLGGFGPPVPVDPTQIETSNGTTAPSSDYTVIKPCPNAVNHTMGVTCQICNTTLTGDVTTVVHAGHQKIRQFNELRKRAKATGVWKDGMKLKDLETALLAIHD